MNNSTIFATNETEMLQHLLHYLWELRINSNKHILVCTYKDKKHIPIFTIYIWLLTRVSNSSDKPHDFCSFLSCNIYCAVSLLRILKALKISLLKKIKIFLLPWMAYYNLILYFNQLIIRLLVIKLIFPVIIRVLCTFFYLTNINNSQAPYRNICEKLCV